MFDWIKFTEMRLKVMKTFDFFHDNTWYIFIEVRYLNFVPIIDVSSILFTSKGKTMKNFVWNILRTICSCVYMFVRTSTNLLWTNNRIFHRNSRYSVWRSLAMVPNLMKQQQCLDFLDTAFVNDSFSQVTNTRWLIFSGKKIGIF